MVCRNVVSFIWLNERTNEQTGDISYRCDLNFHSYWNPCNSIIQSQRYKQQQSPKQKCARLLCSTLENVIFGSLSFVLSFSLSLFLLHNIWTLKSGSVKSETLAVYIRMYIYIIDIWMLVHLIYRHAVTICLTMVWYDCMHEIAIRMSDSLCVTFYTTKPNSEMQILFKFK